MLLPVVAVGALLVASRNIVIHEGHSDYNKIRARELSATAARASRVHNSASVSDVVLEAYVLSNRGEKLANFRETNVGMNESVVAWWPATDGSSASTMKRWATLTKTPLFDPSSRPLPPDKIEDKGDGSRTRSVFIYHTGILLKLLRFDYAVMETRPDRQPYRLCA